jgi:choline-sulfatase
MTSPPNILLIMTDQQRGDCLGCDGNPVLETPYLDQLAAEGTLFRHAYSAVPSCIPARATLLTGMDQWHTGLLGMGAAWGPIRSDYAHTLPGELARGGYHTQGIGKMHFKPARALNGFHHTILDEHHMDQPGQVSDYKRWFEQHKTESYGIHDHGLDWNSWMARPSHLPEHLHPTHWTAQQAIDFLARRDPTKPFFLKVSFVRPHSPYDPPQRYYDLYKDQPIPAPHIGVWAAVNDDPVEAAKIDAWRGRRSAEEIRRARACYYGNITFIDHQIGRLLLELRYHHRAAWDNTLVVFLSDHGDMLGDHHLWRKAYAYEGSARIPMIVRPPNTWTIPRGQVLEPVVELRDVMPTLLEAAGLEVPPTCQGQSMLPLVLGRPGVCWRPYLHGEHGLAYHTTGQANHYLTDGRTKYIWFPYLGHEQLFDLEADPGECRDLARQASKAAKLKLWRSRLVAILTRRDCGLTRAGKLVRQPSDRVVTHPYGKGPDR